MKMSYKIALLVAAGVLVLAVIMMTRPSDESTDPTTADATPATGQTQAPPRKSLLSDPSQDGSVKSLTRNTTPKPQPESPRSNFVQDVHSRINAAGADQPAAPKTDQTALASNTDITPPATPPKPATDPAGNGAIPLTRTDTGEASASNQTKPTPNPAPAISSGDLDAILGQTPAPKPLTATTGNTGDNTGSNTANITTATGAPAPGTVVTGETYTVQAGETFSSIAKKLYNDETRWFDIAQANPLVDPTKLRVGQVLRLPDMQAPAPREDALATGPEGIRSYTIKPGDSLSTIAEWAYEDPTLWRVIYNYNRDKIGDNPNAIQAGMILKVPPRITGAQ